MSGICRLGSMSIVMKMKEKALNQKHVSKHLTGSVCMHVFIFARATAMLPLEKKILKNVGHERKKKTQTFIVCPLKNI